MKIGNVSLNKLELKNIGVWPKPVRIFMLGGISALVLLAGYYMIISDKLGSLQAKKIELQAISKTFAETQKKVDALEDYRAEVENMTKQLAELTLQLPQTNDEAGLLEGISQQAASNGLQFLEVKPGKQANKVFYQEMPIEFSLSGNFGGLAGFLSDVANKERIVTFHDFTIRTLDKVTPGGPKGPLTMTIQSKTYWVQPMGICE